MIPSASPIFLRETKSRIVDLTNDEAAVVRALGSRLASNSTWWGNEMSSADVFPEASDETQDDRTAIECSMVSNGRWRIRVANAIGAFGVGNSVFIVEPKIPLNHALYILAAAQVMPRLESAPVSLSTGSDFFDLIAQWFCAQVRRVIASDLARDYEEFTDLSSSVRGHVNAMETAQRYYQGLLSAVCTFDEFSVDNALNRTLLAALVILQSMPVVGHLTKRECRRLTSYFQDVGALRDSDVRAACNRRTEIYRDAMLLARLILNATALSLTAGGQRGWTFLIRMPEPIEAGIRRILDRGLTGEQRVLKFRTALNPQTMTVSPDLRFEPSHRVGDVKYKILGSEWPRGDLYQSVAFAAATNTAYACVVSFADGVSPLPPVSFANIEVCNLVWPTTHRAMPMDAETALLQQVRDWLANH